MTEPIFMWMHVPCPLSLSLAPSLIGGGKEKREWPQQGLKTMNHRILGRAPKAVTHPDEAHQSILWDSKGLFQLQGTIGEEGDFLNNT